MTEYQIDENCLNCKSSSINRQTISDYTGGGFADYYDEYECETCGHVWKRFYKSDYA